MNKTRLEAFSDGVVAILITIMVLDLKGPHEVSFACLVPRPSRARSTPATTRK